MAEMHNTGESTSECGEKAGSEKRCGRSIALGVCGLLKLPMKLLRKGFDTAIGAMNPEVATHLIQSDRELLLAVRSFIDHEINMADHAIEKVKERKLEGDAAQREETPSI